MRMFDLSGRVAIVTGGNGGLGYAMASGLAEAGAQLALFGRDAAKGADAVARLRAAGHQAAFSAVDVTNEAAVRAGIAGVVAQTGRLDILVNNAGQALRQRPEDYTLADWHRVIDTNLTSAFLMCNAAYPHMKASGGGSIINIASILAQLAAPFSAVYSASKAGLLQFSRGLATAWAAEGIRCNAILPGWIETELTEAARAQVAGLDDNVKTRTPAGRWGRPVDLAGAAVFLASDASAYVTGTSIVVDGGYTIRS
jgi:2-deoxy-D-gluconate 3-dehydrogenase